MEWVEVASDAVKIGLGALITVIGSIVTSLLHARSVRKKDKAAHKKELIDSAIGIFVEYNKIYAEFKSETLGFHNARVPSVEVDFNNEETKRIIQLSDELVEAGKEFYDIEAKLMVLGSDEGIKVMHKFLKSISDFQELLWVSNKSFSKKEFDNLVDITVNYRRALFIIFRNLYD